MKKIEVFRALIVCYAILHVLSLISFHRLIVPEQAKEYSEYLHAMFFDPWGSIFWTILVFFGVSTVAIGAIVLLFRRRMGIYIFIFGSAVARIGVFAISNPDSYPFLESTSTSLLYGATCITWGAIVTMALENGDNVLK